MSHALTPKLKHSYVPALDGLRTIAVLLVLAAHGEVPHIRSGAIGVDIFFVLSGFLITSLLSTEIERTGKLRLRNFYIRRVLRLAPCLLLTTALFALWFYVTNGRFPWTPVLIALTHTANWARAFFDAKLFGLDHYWSLASEEQYYLLWPLVVIGIERMWREPLQKGVSLLAIAVGLMAYRFAMVGVLPDERIYFGLDTHMDGLVLGSALSYFVKLARRSPAAYTFNGAMLGCVIVPASVLLLVAICLTMSWQSPEMGRFGFTAVAFASAFIIYDLVNGTASLMRAPLSLAPMVYLGRISYGLYLLHLPIFFALDHRYPDVRWTILLPIKVALSIAAAAASYHFIESYFLRLKSRFDAPAGAPTRHEIEPAPDTSTQRAAT